MPKGPPWKDGTCGGKLIKKNPRITLGFCSPKSPTKNKGMGM
jgi:hypothetical protein